MYDFFEEKNKYISIFRHIFLYFCTINKTKFNIIQNHFLSKKNIKLT